MKRSIVALTLAVTLAAPAAHACSITTRLDPVAAAESADLIVRGTITDYQIVEGRKDGPMFHARMTVNVDETVKGDPVDEVIVVFVDNMGVPPTSPWGGVVTVGARALKGDARENYDAGFAVIGGICAEPFVIIEDG